MPPEALPPGRKVEKQLPVYSGRVQIGLRGEPHRSFPCSSAREGAGGRPPAEENNQEGEYLPFPRGKPFRGELSESIN